MPSGVEFAVIGDLMVECMLPEVPPGTTRIYDPGELALGGPALNVAWHLAHLGWRSRLIGCSGDRDEGLLQPFAEAGVELSDVIRQPGTSDLLVVLSSGDGHRSVYIRAPISEATFERMLAACRGADCIVLNGSRHPRLRRGFAELAASSHAFVAFNPSYAVFTYDRQELEAVVAAADLTIVNERESEWVCELLDAPNAGEVSGRYCKCFVTTLEDRGAIVHRDGRSTTVESVSNVTGNVLGAGDAFLTGLVAEMLAGRTAEDAGAFAAALASFVARTRELRPAVPEAAVRERMRQHQTRHG